MPGAGRKRRAPADEEDDVPTPTQTQRTRRQLSPDDDEDEDEQQHGASGSLAQLSKSLVRYALASEYSRTSIRRQDVNQKVLGSRSRAFKEVFDAANGQLLDVFGMQMVELPAREKVTMRQKRAAAASEVKDKTSNQWVLRNVLPDRFRASDIISPPQVPTAEAESAYVGFYTMIIALISLCGGQLSEGKLDRFLKRMNADQSTSVDSTDKLMARMIKEGYIVKIKDSSGGEEIVDYMVGPRGKVEAAEDAVANLVRTVYGGAMNDELEQKLRRSLNLTDGAIPQQRAVNGEGTVSTQGGERRRGRPRRQRSEDEGDGDE